MEDRVAQTIVGNALEPSWEARFEAHSYGFRVGRSCHDAIEQCHTRLRKGGDMWILDADLRGAFDNLNHDFMLNTIGSIPGRELIRQWLKAGYVEAEMFYEARTRSATGGTRSRHLQCCKKSLPRSGVGELGPTLKTNWLRVF